MSDDFGIDLNDKDVLEKSTSGDYTKFVPRCDADYEVKVLSFEIFKKEETEGVTAIIEIVSAEQKGKHECYEMPAEAGEERQVDFAVKVSKPNKPWKKQHEGAKLRSFAAAASGKADDGDFDANDATRKLLKLAVAEKLDKLPTIGLRVTCRPKTADDGKTYANEKLKFYLREDS